MMINSGIWKNDVFVGHSINELNTVCRICHLEVILSNFNGWDRYLCHFDLFGANNTLYEALRWYWQKRLNITRCICRLEVILRRISTQTVTLYTPNVNCSKNTLYGSLRRCCRLSTMCGYAFFVEALYFGVTALHCNSRVTSS